MPLAVCWPLLAEEPLPADEPDAVSPAASIPDSADPARNVAAPDVDDLLADIAPLPASPDSDEVTTSGIGNEDVLAMVRAEFSESTIIAAIDANETRFDVSPRALVELKQEGVPESVIEAMLAAAAAKRQAAASTAVAEPAVPPAETSVTQPPQGLGSPEQRAGVPTIVWRGPTQLPNAAPQPDHVPTVWLVDGDVKVPLDPTVAQIALTDGSRGAALKTLKGLAGRALRFAHPALGVAGSFGGLFGANDREMTVVWALLGPSSTRTLAGNAVFEVMYDGIPGLNPDEYRPAIVQLVPTSDNFRLVGAAETSLRNAGLPSGPITEERVEAEITQIGRGHYQVGLMQPLAPGEYALVLRPTTEPRSRGRRRKDDSLGELLGGGSSRVIYLTWDFSIGS